MTQTSRLVIEIDSRNAEQKAADVSKALEALESAGLSIKPAMDRAGSGMEGLSKSSEKAKESVQDQREQIAQLLGSIDPLTRKMNELEKQELALAKARKSGKIDLDTFNEYQGKLNTTRAALSGFDSDLNRTGMTAKATAAALRGVPAQFTDIAVSLQGGQAPLTVFLQQGGQLKDMFGGVAPAAKALGGYIAGLVNPFTVAAAAAAALGLAHYQGSEEADAYRLAILGTGNAAGSSVGELSTLAERISSVTGTTSGAAAALAQIAGSGKIASDSFEMVALAAVSFQKATGKAVSDTVAEFARLGDDPVKAVADLNNKYNFLTASVYEQIRAAQEMGEKEAAAAIAQEAYAKALTDRAAKAKQDLGYIESAWNGIRSAASRAWDAMLDVGREDSLEEKISDLQVNIARREKNGFTVKPYQDQLDALQKQLALRNANAKAEADTARVQREGQAAYEGFQKSIEANLTKRQKMNKALEDEEKRIAVARAAGYTITSEEEAASLKAIRESAIYKEAVAKKEKAYTEAAGIRALDQAKQQYAVLQQRSSLIDTQSDQSQRLGSAAQALIKWEQELSDIKEKKTLTADQKSLLANQELITAQLKRNAGLEKENELTKDRLENAAKLLSFQDQLNDSLETEQQGLDSQIAGLGSGSKLQARIREDLKIRQGYQKQLAKLQRDYQRIVNPTAEQTDLYEKETKAVKDALGQRLSMQEDYYQRLDAAQSDWAVGANDAWYDYLDEASDISSQTYDLFSNTFHGIEDAIAEAARSGKLSFKDLADSIIADLSRMAARAYITVPLLSALGLGGSSGGSGGLTSLLSGSSNGGGGLSSLWDIGTKAYGVATSGFGSAVSAGWAAGEGFLGGVQGAISGGYGYISNAVSGLFSGGAAATGASNVGFGLGQSLVSGGVGSSGAAAGSGASYASGSGGATALGGALAGIGGALYGYGQSGFKGAATGAAGGVGGYYAGAAIGSLVGPLGTVIGGVIGSALGSFLGGSLFGGDWVTKDQGIRIGVDSGELEAKQFEYQKKKGGLFSSNKKRTKLSALDPEMQVALDNTYDATIGSVEDLFERLNVTLTDGVLDGLNIDAVQISTKNKTSEEIQKELEVFFGDVAHEAVFAISEATNAGLSGFTFEHLTEFVNNLYGVNDVIKHLNVGLFDMTATGGFMAEQLSAWAGGFDALRTSVATYYDAFFTDAEKSANVLGDVRKEFSDLGVTLPETRQGYRDMVEALDLTTESGRAMFITLTGLAGDAAQAYGVLEARSGEAIQSALEAVQRAVGAQKSALTDAYNAQISSINDLSQAAQNSASDLASVGESLSRALKSLRGDSADAVKMLRVQALATLQSALSAARAGKSLAGIDGLSDALEVVSQNSTDAYASLEDYNRDQGRAANLVSELESANGKQLTAAEKSLESLQSQAKQAEKAYQLQIAQYDAQLTAAQAQVDALNGVDNSVLSVASAVAGLSQAITNALGSAALTGQQNTADNNVSLLRAVYQSVLGRDLDPTGQAGWSAALANGSVTYATLADAIAKAGAANGEKVRVPGYASGGDFGGGIRLVGERGPELEVTGPSRIFSANKTAEMLAGAGGTASEIRALREEMKAALFAIAKNTLKAAKNTDLLPRKLEEELFA